MRRKSLSQEHSSGPTQLEKVYFYFDTDARLDRAMTPQNSSYLKKQQKCGLRRKNGGERKRLTLTVIIAMRNEGERERESLIQERKTGMQEQK